MGDRRSFCQSSWKQVRSPGACHIPYEVQSNRHLLQKLASCLLHAIQMHQQLKSTRLPALTALSASYVLSHVAGTTCHTMAALCTARH